MKLFALLVLCFAACRVKAQDTLPITVKQVSHSRFIDCYASKDHLVALAQDGAVYHIRLGDLAFEDTTKYWMKASAIGKDRNGMIWAADRHQSLYSLRDTGWKREKYVAGATYQFVFNSRNELFLLTSRGVYNSKTEMFYGTNNDLDPWLRLGTHITNPVTFYIDHADNIWMHWISRSSGEVQVFSTRDNTFIKLGKTRRLLYARFASIFGSGERIFLTEKNRFGLSDLFSYRSDSLKRLLHPEFEKVIIPPPVKEEEYLGASFFNDADHSIYFFSGRGLFKAKYDATADKIGQPQRVLPPQHSWFNNLPDPEEFATYVSKLFVHEGMIVYLNSNSGLFVFKDEKLYNLR